MDAPNFNEDKPSRADHFRRDPYAADGTGDVIGEGIRAAQESLGAARQQAGEALTRAEATVTRTVGPYPALAVAGFIGFAAGYAFGMRRS